MDAPTPQAVPVHHSGHVQRPFRPVDTRRNVKRRRAGLRTDVISVAPLASVEKDSDANRDSATDPLAQFPPTKRADRASLANQPTLLEMVTKLSRYFATQGDNANRLLSELTTLSNDYGHYTQLATLKQNSVDEIKHQLRAQKSTNWIMTIVGDLVGIIFAVSIGALVGGPAGAIAGLAVGLANAALSFPYTKNFTPYGWIANQTASGLGLKGKDRFMFETVLKIGMATAVGVAAGGAVGVYYGVEAGVEEGVEDAVVEETPSLLGGIASDASGSTSSLTAGQSDDLEAVSGEISESTETESTSGAKTFKDGAKALLGRMTRFGGDTEEASDDAPGTVKVRKTYWLRRATYTFFNNFNTIAQGFTSDDEGARETSTDENAAKKKGKLHYSNRGSDGLWTDMFRSTGVSSKLSGYLAMIPEGLIDIGLMVGGFGGSAFFGETMQGTNMAFLAKIMPYLQYLGLGGNLAMAGTGAYENSVNMSLLGKLGQRAKDVALYQKQATDVQSVTQAVSTMLTRMGDRSNDLMSTIRGILDNVPEIFRTMQV